jgi:ATP-dependent exoDNAse (exonuclease V) beta subunit
LVVHRVLEHCDFARPAEIRRLCVQAAEAVQAPAAALPAEDLVRRFLATPRAGAVASARQVRRELPFLLPWPAAGSAEPPRHIEGVIDCLYQDASGGWRLLDYKTHKASPGRAADAAARYEIQLYVYAEACRQALGAPLEEVALCFLDSGEELAFSWSTGERAALEQRVTAAVKSLIDRVQPW